MVVPGANTIILFMLSALALNITPGPSILFILSRCLGQGRRDAVVSVFGLATASVIQAIAAAYGLAALFAYSVLAFTVVKFGGAAYLIYLGVRGFWAGGLASLDGVTTGRGVTSMAVAFRQGLITDLLNPKLLLFFFAFLPQFVDPVLGGARSQMLVLGLLFQVTALPTNLAVAFAGGTFANFLARRPAWARLQSWVSSAVLVGLGLRLALAEPR